MLATALAAGATAASAARQFDIGLSTVKRRMAEQAFQQLVANLRAEMVAAALGRMTDNFTRAADRIASLLDSDNASVSLRASRALIGLGLKMHQAVDVDEQLQLLKAEFAQLVAAQQA